MNIYIGYKLSKISEEDKKNLRAILERISSTLEKKGHVTFVMGRDVQNWTKEYVSSINTLSKILKNIIKYDVLLLFDNSQSKSTGMLLEFITAKILGKKTHLYIKEGIKDTFFEKNADTVNRFTDIDNLENILNRSY